MTTISPHALKNRGQIPGCKYGIHIIKNNKFHDDDYTSRIEKPRSNTWTHPIFFIKNIQYIISVIWKNEG